MQIEPKKIILKNGKICILRNPTGADAKQLIEFLKITAEDTLFLEKYPEEITYTEESEAKVLEDRLHSKRNIMIAAEVDGKLVGNFDFSAAGSTLRKSHRCTCGIALCNGFWGLGIGTECFKYAFECARKIGYEQMELAVISTNERALALYHKMGFEKFGKRVKGFKYKDGTYADEYLMVKFL